MRRKDKVGRAATITSTISRKRRTHFKTYPKFRSATFEDLFRRLRLLVDIARTTSVTAGVEIGQITNGKLGISRPITNAARNSHLVISGPIHRHSSQMFTPANTAMGPFWVILRCDLDVIFAMCLPNIAGMPKQELKGPPSKPYVLILRHFLDKVGNT